MKIMLRLLFGAVFLAVIGWAGYWFMGASAQESAVENWLSDRQADGWIAETQSLNVKGFPNRFDTEVKDLRLADPETGWAWSAPDFNIRQLSYQPNHLIVQLPQQQTLSSPAQTIEIETDEMRSSVVFQPSTDMALERFTAEFRDMVLKSSDGWASSIEEGVIATRSSETTEKAYDIAVDAKGFVPSDKLRAEIDRKGVLPEAFESLKIEATAAFDREWDRPAIEDNLPNLTGVKLDRSRAVWGALELQASGAVAVDELGYPTGKVTVRAKNWKDMITLAENTGALSRELARTLESGLSLLAMISGDGDFLEAPLSFGNRVMSIGPIPIGDAPRLVWQY